MPDRPAIPETFTSPAMLLTKPPVVRAEMLIRRPADQVYAAFVDPAITSRFWFTRGSRRLEPGADVEWTWEMYGASATVRVLELQEGKRILVEWDDPPTRVEWRFTPRPDGATFVSITNEGFTGSGDELLAKALDSQGGFSFLLAAAKAFLEHGITLELVGDHAPDAHVAPFQRGAAEAG